MSDSPFKIPTSCEQSTFSARKGEGFERCNYCGSLKVADAIALLKTPGVHFSGSDWKYGWPHKFYIDANGVHAKFYNKHLKQATDEELAEFDRLSRKCFGIAWARDEKGVKFVAPKTGAQSYGWQLDGTIGPDGEPQFSEFSKIDTEWLAKLMEGAFDGR